MTIRVRPKRTRPDPTIAEGSGFALKPLLQALRRASRLVSVVALAFGGIVFILLGLALIYPPAALIGIGLALFGVLTFDRDRASRLTWPR